MTKDDDRSIEAAIEEMLSGETDRPDRPKKGRAKAAEEPATAQEPKIVDEDRPEIAEQPGTDEESRLEEPPVIGEDDGVAAELETLRAERDELRDRFYRALADAENARKRSDRDRREAENYGGSKLSRDILPVYDNLKRALDSVDEEQRRANEALLEGIDLTMRELVKVFEKHGIRMISPQVGDRFDPKLHEAMFEAPVPETRAGDIIQVMAEGFMLHDRLLRAAHVGVSSNPAK